MGVHTFAQTERCAHTCPNRDECAHIAYHFYALAHMHTFFLPFHTEDLVENCHALQTGKQTVLLCAFEKMVSTLLLAINGSTIFNLSDMQAKQSDADEDYTNPPFRDKRRENGSLLSFELLHF